MDYKKQRYTQSDISRHLNIARIPYENLKYAKADSNANSIMHSAELYNISIDRLFEQNAPLQRNLESIKVALADLPVKRQQESLDVLIDYSYFIKKHFTK